jgi:hypothetical protein
MPTPQEDRTRLTTMVQALNASPRTLRRPLCRGWSGDYQITGKCGHILTDGAGFLLFVSTSPWESKRRWSHSKKTLNQFCRLTQNGDDEGCFHLSHLPSPAEASSIRKIIGITQRRQSSTPSVSQIASRFKSKTA